LRALTEWADDLFKPLVDGDKRELLGCAVWLLRWIGNRDRYEPPTKVRELARLVGHELFSMDAEFELGIVDHMEEYLGRKRPKYWRRHAKRRRMALAFRVWAAIGSLRDQRVSVLDACEQVGSEVGISASLAQRWYYEERRLHLASPIPNRLARDAEGQRLIATLGEKRAAVFSYERSKTNMKKPGR
jgi:hypothetical protein